MRWKEKIQELSPIALRAALVMLIMYYPIGLLHEFGHYVVGYNFGSLCEVNYLELGVTCTPPPQPILLYWALGGIFGMIGSSAPIISSKVRKTKWILIGVLTAVFSQFVNFLFETFAHFAYISNFMLGLIMFISTGLFFLALLKFFGSRLE